MTNACTIGYFGARPDLDLGKCNYIGVAGALGDGVHTASPSDGPGVSLQKYVGIYTNRSKNKTSTITDGSSNTLAFGEILGGASNAGAKRDFIIPWIGAGSLPAGPAARIGDARRRFVEADAARGRAVIANVRREARSRPSPSNPCGWTSLLMEVVP